MELVILLMAIHFTLGAAGIFLASLKLPRAESKKDWLKYFSYLIIFILVISAAFAGREFMIGISILIYSAGLMEILIVSKGSCRISRDRTVGFTIFIYLLLAILFSMFLFLPMNLIIFTYILVVIFDGSSQVTGKLIGKHKITPAISPAKTKEGFAGGMISAVLTGVIVHKYAGISIGEALILCLIICFAAFCGDIAASSYKRAFSVKDFSRILPGQGGVLDRFDSFIFAGAIIGPIGFVFAAHPGIDRNLAAYLAYSVCFLFILFAAEAMQHFFRLRSEYSRIISHTITGFLCIFLTTFFTSGIYIIVFCLQSAAFIYVSKKMKVLNGLNGVERETEGATYFFIGIIMAFLISEMLNDRSFFILPVLVMTFCDPAAAMTGMTMGTGRHNRFGKTLAGSAAFLISAFAIMFAGLIFYRDMNSSVTLIIAVSISFISAFAEYLSGSGLDNITVPAVISAAMIIVRGIF